MLSELSSRRIVVTGPTSGVGLALAKNLAVRGAHVVLAARDRARADEVLREITASGGRASVLDLDLADLGSVRAAAASLGPEPIDVLVNNAAIAGARGTTRDGFEIAFGTNHLGHYLFTRLLLDRITQRIVHVGSGSHASAHRIAWDACERTTRTATGIDEYAVSKLAVTLFHHELSRRLASRGPSSLLADPGNVATRAYRHLPGPIRMLWTLGMQTAEEGARTPLHCVTGDVVRGGSYRETRESETSAASRSVELASALWDRSAQWVGLGERAS